ncbi:hypothetical protein FB009_12732 [Sinorhizobium medicae]|nr:hypothetical protein FB009_12732 [Sinorhizobium medicae]
MPSQSAIRSPNLLAVAVSTGTRALAYLAVPSVIFGPCGGLYAEHTVAGEVHLRKTEAGRMHSLNVAGIMILLAIVALFVLA